jgi:hypothetical protein
LKQSHEPPVTLGMFAVLGYAPQMLQDRLFNLLISRATAVMTNLPGPQSPLYMGGAEIKQIMFWVPQSGDIGMGVSILSFNGMVQFGLITDAQMVPDPEAIIAHFRPQFEELLYYVLMSPWGEDADAAVQQSAAEAPVTRSGRSRSVSKPRVKGAQAKSPSPPEPAPVAEASKSRPNSKPGVKSTPAKLDTQAVSPAPPQPDTEARVAEARKSGGPSKPRAKSARPKSPAAPEPKTEAPVAQARKQRSQPRTRGTQTKTVTQAKPEAAPEPKRTARRKLPRK